MNKKLAIILDFIQLAIAVVALPFACMKGELFWIISDIVYILICIAALVIALFYHPKSKSDVEDNMYNDLSQEQIEMIKAKSKNNKTGF
ncbi:MAG: hypothetical protein IK028_03550 [Bacilli bacterium]|nr:hypothetical protein [Bacilli bacterium]